MRGFPHFYSKSHWFGLGRSGNLGTESWNTVYIQGFPVSTDWSDCAQKYAGMGWHQPPGHEHQHEHVCCRAEHGALLVVSLDFESPEEFRQLDYSEERGGKEKGFVRMNNNNPG